MQESEPVTVTGGKAQVSLAATSFTTVLGM
jgi:hypothetical protein